MSNKAIRRAFRWTAGCAVLAVIVIVAMMFFEHRPERELPKPEACPVVSNVIETIVRVFAPDGDYARLDVRKLTCADFERRLKEVSPAATLWTPGEGDWLIVGAKQGCSNTLERVLDVFSNEETAFSFPEIFANCVGTVGEITSETISKPAPRAKVDFAAVSRPVAGSELSFAVTPNAGAAVGDTLTTRWYRADATGREVPGTSRAGGLAYALSAADFGHWIAVDVSDESGYVGTGRFWASDLPVVYLTAGEEGAWEWPTGMKEDHTGWIRIVGNAEYPDQCDCAVKFHVRGNSTAWEDKKPYKLKLDKKADLFGLGGGVANKHWNLLANVYDESLMRNKLSYDLSAEFGAPVAMRSEWVDVVMNGQYVGNYQLCQHVRISEERVNVYDWSKAMEKIAEAAREANPALSEDDQDEIESLLETDCRWMTTGEFTYLSTNYTVKAKGTPGVDGDGHVTVVWKKFTTDISGGYLFEIDHRSVLMQPEPSCFAQTNRTDKGNLLLCVIANEPEYAFTNPDVRDFCWNAWEQLSLAWLDERGQSPDGRHYRELADFDSMVAYWLSMYVPGNNDASFLSRFAYLDQGGKMTFGPAWDFDYGLGSLQIRNTFGTVTNENGSVSYAPIQPERWIPGSGWENFMAQWTSDPYFTYCLRERYRATRAYLADMVKSGGLIDRYAAKLANSARANDLRWNNRIGFSADVDALRNFLTRRFAWLDGKFATVGNALVDVGDTVLSASLKYKRTASLAATLAGATNLPGSVETTLPDVGCLAWREPVTGTVSVPAGATALEVSVNGLPLMTVPVENGTAALSIPVAALTLRARNFIGLDAVDDRGEFVARNAVLLTCDSPAPLAILLR